MWTDLKLLKSRKVNIKKLISFGFTKSDNAYVLTKDILDGNFSINAYAKENNTLLIEVIDKETGDEYTLAYIDGAVGAFVGKIKEESENFFSEILDNCYDIDVFKSDYTKLVIEYVENKYRRCPEFLWGIDDGNAVFRCGKTKKWFGVLLTVGYRKLGIDKDGDVEIIDLKATPERVTELVDGVMYHGGYHMNKKHWYTIKLDGTVDIEKIKARIDESYEAVTQKAKNNKAQR